MKVTAAVVGELHGPFRIDEPGPGEALVRIVWPTSGRPSTTAVAARCSSPSSA